MHHRSIALPAVVTLTTLALLVACQTEILDQQAPTTTQTASDIGSAPVRIRYEIETLTVTTFDAPPTDQSAFLYRNRSLPVANRSAVELGIYEDGSSDWIITNLVPTIDIPSPQANIPADDTPKTEKTLINKGYARFYDKKGTMLHTQQMQIPSFKDVVENLKKDTSSPALTARIAAGVPNVDLEERLADAKKSGSTVTDLGKGMVSIRSKVDRNSQYSGTKFDGKEMKLYAVDMWDTVNKIMLGTRLYDEKGDQVLSQTLFRYENGRNLTQSTHATYGKDPRGVAYTATTDSYFRNMEFTSSFTKK